MRHEQLDSLFAVHAEKAKSGTEQLLSVAMAIHSGKSIAVVVAHGISMAAHEAVSTRQYYLSRAFTCENIVSTTVLQPQRSTLSPSMMTNPSTQWEFKPYTKTIHRAVYHSIGPKNPSNSAAGKVIVVTGGGAGVGKGIAKAFVQAGAKAVVILGRRENLLKDVKSELEKEGSAKILYFVADVCDKPSLDQAFEATEREVGKVDVAVANAGFMSNQVIAAESDVADFWASFEINVKGAFLTWQAFIAHKGNNTPTFISLNTAAAHVGVFPKFSAYGVSKTA